MSYGNEKKQIYFESTDDKHARLIVKLRHHRMGQGEFFRSLIEGYIEDDPRIDDFFEEYRKTKQNYSGVKEKILKKEREGAENITKQFALDEQEIEDIYDLFEEEMDI